MSVINDFINSVGQIPGAIGNAVTHPVQTIENNLPSVGGLLGGLGGAVAGGMADIPTGIIPGAVAGGVAGAGLGGSVGETIRQKIQNQPANLPAIVQQGALAAGGEALGAGVGALGGKALSAAGGALGDYGSNLVTKALNLTPKATYDTTKAMGETSLPNFLKQRGLQGADYNKLDSYIRPIQDKFDSIAKNPAIKINPSDVVQGFSDQINKLNQSIMPAVRNQGNELQKIALNFIDTHGHLPEIGADALTSLRKEIDARVKDFAGDPVVSSTARITRNVLQDSIQQADPTGQLQGLGQELKKLYTLSDAAAPRQFATAAKPFIGAKDAAAAFIGNLFGGVPGAVAGVGIDKALGSKLGTSVISKGAQLGGAALKGMGDLSPSVVGAASAGLLPAIGNTNKQTQTGNLPPITDGGFPLVMKNPTPINGMDITKNYDPKTAQWAAPDISKMTTPKDAPNLKTTPASVYQMMQDPSNYNFDLSGMLAGAKGQVKDYMDSHNVGADQIDFVNNYPQTANNLNTLEDAIVKHPTGWLNTSEGIQAVNSYTDPSFGTAMGMLNNSKIANIKTTQGRAPSIIELQQAGLFPTAGDSQKTAISKLNQVQSELQQNLSTYAPAVNWYNSVTAGANQANNSSSQKTVASPVQQPVPTLPPIVPQQANYQYSNGGWNLPAIK
jgi:hypothetical protein